MILLGLLVIELLVIYLTSRWAQKELFIFLTRFIKSHKAVALLIAIIFFPGTAIHEMAHFLMAMVLLLKVREIRLFPEIRETDIKLGHVSYEKRDVVRSLLVGIAPIAAGLLFFWFISSAGFFPTNSLIMNILFGYLIYVISSTMFSSVQDLVDLLYLIPLSIIIIGVIYIFNINLGLILLNSSFAAGLQRINLYLFFSIIINGGIILTIKIMSYLSK